MTPLAHHLLSVCVITARYQCAPSSVFIIYAPLTVSII